MIDKHISRDRSARASFLDVRLDALLETAEWSRPVPLFRFFHCFDDCHHTVLHDHASEDACQGCCTSLSNSDLLLGYVMSVSTLMLLRKSILRTHVPAFRCDPHHGGP